MAPSIAFLVQQETNSHHLANDTNRLLTGLDVIRPLLNPYIGIFSYTVKKKILCASAMFKCCKETSLNSQIFIRINSRTRVNFLRCSQRS